jgi:hypothetical protein
LLSTPDELRLRMHESGYLYLKSFLNPQDVWQARLEIANCLANEGSLKVGSPIEDCIAKPGLTMSFRPDLALHSPMLKTLLYSGKIINFFQLFLGGDVRHYGRDA